MQASPHGMTGQRCSPGRPRDQKQPSKHVPSSKRKNSQSAMIDTHVNVHDGHLVTRKQSQTVQLPADDSAPSRLLACRSTSCDGLEQALGGKVSLTRSVSSIPRRCQSHRAQCQQLPLCHSAHFRRLDLKTLATLILADQLPFEKL